MKIPYWPMPAWLCRIFNWLFGADTVVPALECQRCGTVVVDLVPGITQQEIDNRCAAHDRFFHPDAA